MTDLTSLGLETTALARGANQLGLTALVECGRQIHDGDPAWFLGLLRDFDKLAAEILRLRALIAPGEGCETTEEERKAVPTWRAINGDSPFMARLLRDLARAEASAKEATAALAAAEEREAEWAKGRRPFQNQNAVIAAQVKRIDDLNAALGKVKEALERMETWRRTAELGDADTYSASYVENGLYGLISLLRSALPDPALSQLRGPTDG